MSGNSAKVNEKSGKRPKVREKSGKGQRICVNLIVTAQQNAGNQTGVNCA